MVACTRRRGSAARCYAARVVGDPDVAERKGLLCGASRDRREWSRACRRGSGRRTREPQALHVRVWLHAGRMSPQGRRVRQEPPSAGEDRGEISAITSGNAPSHERPPARNVIFPRRVMSSEASGSIDGTGLGKEHRRSRGSDMEHNCLASPPVRVYQTGDLVMVSRLFPASSRRTSRSASPRIG